MKMDKVDCPICGGNAYKAGHGFRCQDCGYFEPGESSEILTTAELRDNFRFEVDPISQLGFLGG